MSTQTAIGQQRRTKPQEPAVSGRLAGAAGLIFAVTLVADNIIRASAPGQGASPAQVTEYFLHHRVAALVPLGLNTFGVALFPFVAALWAMARAERTRWWAGTGALAVATIAALFGVVTTTEIVLTAKAGSLAASDTDSGDTSATLVGGGYQLSRLVLQRLRTGQNGGNALGADHV